MKILLGMPSPAQPVIDLSHQSCMDVNGRQSANYMAKRFAVLSTIITVTSALITALYYLPSDHYKARISYVYKAMKCMRPEGPATVPGCKNHVYCEYKDPTRKIYPEGMLGIACHNDDVNHFAFEGSKEGMESTVNLYLKRSLIEQKIDEWYRYTFLSWPDSNTKSVENYTKV